MEMSRRDITEFMGRYFEAFSTIAQDPRENHRMSEFFSPDLLVTAYLGDIGQIGREEFLLRTCSHPEIQEILTPKQMIIDEAQGTLAALVYIEMIDKATGGLIKDVWFSAHYKFKLDENTALKIERLSLFAQYPRPGEKSLFEIYEEEARKLFAEKAK